MGLVKGIADYIRWFFCVAETRGAAITPPNAFNHTYARRPLHARDPFYAFWADGDSETFSPSRLYFTDRSGARIRRLPETIDGKEAEPVIVGPDG